MTLSDAARKTVLAHLNASLEFVTYMGMKTPFTIIPDDSAEVQTALHALNGLLNVIFPQIECSYRDQLFGCFRPPTPAEFHLLESLASSMENAGLRARAYEILWAFRMGKAKPEDAIMAAEAYLDYLHAMSTQDSNDGTATLERAMRLSGTYARHPKGTPVYLRAQQQALQSVQDTAADLNRRCVDLSLLIKMWKDAPGGVTRPDLLTCTSQLDQLQRGAGNHPWRLSLAEFRQELASTMEPAERLAARHHFVIVRAEEGDACAADHPVRAKQAYMDAERRYVDLVMPAEVDQMKLKGAALGAAIFAEMKPMEVDISDYVAFSKSIAERRLQQTNTMGGYLAALAAHHAVQPKVPESSTTTPLRRLFGQIHSPSALVRSHALQCKSFRPAPSRKTERLGSEKRNYDVSAGHRARDMTC